MHPRKLPLELSDHIIDFLWLDRSALVACSLTCRAWLRRSRYHLFRTVELCGEADCLRLENLLTSSLAASSGIPFYIRDLTIHSCNLVPGNKLPQAAKTSWMGRFLPKLFTSLTAVECLQLTGMDWQRDFQEARDAFLTSFPALQVIILDDVRFEESIHVLRLLASHPLLNTICMIDVFWIVESPFLVEGDQWAHAGKIGINELMVHDGVSDCGTSIAASVVDAPFKMSLTRLSWASSSALESVVKLGKVIEKAGPSLEDLSLYLTPESGGEAAYPADHISLAHLINLKSLSLKCCFAAMPTAKDTAYIPALLSQVCAARYIRMNIFLTDSPPIQLGLLDWESIDKTLASLGKRLPRLVVVLYIRPRYRTLGWADEVISAITAYLPESQVAGTRVRLLCSMSATRHPDHEQLREHWLSLYCDSK